MLPWRWSRAKLIPLYAAVYGDLERRSVMRSRSISLSPPTPPPPPTHPPPPHPPPPFSPLSASLSFSPPPLSLAHASTCLRIRYIPKMIIQYVSLIQYVIQIMINNQHNSPETLTVIFNLSPPSPAYMRQWAGSALIQVNACHLFGAEPLPVPVLTCCQ